MNGLWINVMIGMVMAIPAWAMGLWAGLRTRRVKTCGCGHALAYHNLAESTCQFQVKDQMHANSGGYYHEMRRCTCAHFTGSVTA